MNKILRTAWKVDKNYINGGIVSDLWCCLRPLQLPLDLKQCQYIIPIQLDNNIIDGVIVTVCIWKMDNIST